MQLLTSTLVALHYRTVNPTSLPIGAYCATKRAALLSKGRGNIVDGSRNKSKDFSRVIHHFTHNMKNNGVRRFEVDILGRTACPDGAPHMLPFTIVQIGFFRTVNSVNTVFNSTPLITRVYF